MTSSTTAEAQPVPLTRRWTFSRQQSSKSKKNRESSTSTEDLLVKTKKGSTKSSSVNETPKATPTSQSTKSTELDPTTTAAPSNPFRNVLARIRSGRLQRQNQNQNQQSVATPNSKKPGANETESTSTGTTSTHDSPKYAVDQGAASELDALVSQLSACFNDQSSTDALPRSRSLHHKSKKKKKSLSAAPFYRKTRSEHQFQQKRQMSHVVRQILESDISWEEEELEEEDITQHNANNSSSRIVVVVESNDETDRKSVKSTMNDTLDRRAQTTQSARHQIDNFTVSTGGSFTVEDSAMFAYEDPELTLCQLLCMGHKQMPIKEQEEDDIDSKADSHFLSYDERSAFY